MYTSELLAHFLGIIIPLYPLIKFCNFFHEAFKHFMCVCSLGLLQSLLLLWVSGFFFSWHVGKKYYCLLHVNLVIGTHFRILSSVAGDYLLIPMLFLTLKIIYHFLSKCYTFYLFHLLLNTFTNIFWRVLNCGGGSYLPCFVLVCHGIFQKIAVYLF